MLKVGIGLVPDFLTLLFSRHLLRCMKFRRNTGTNCSGGAENACEQCLCLRCNLVLEITANYMPELKTLMS